MNAGILAMVLLFDPEPVDGLSTSPIVINEFMATPTASATEAEGEWIELYNKSDEYINLSGWRIRNQGGSQILLNTCLLPPDGYLLLGASGDQNRNGGYTPGQVYSGFTISSSGSLSVLNPQGQIQESFSYDGSWPVSPGFSCERINPGWIAMLSSSWGTSLSTFGSGDFGTPGLLNSVFENSFAENTWAFIKAFVQ